MHEKNTEQQHNNDEPIFFQNLKEEMDDFRTDIDQIHDGGHELVSLIGEPDRAEVERNVDDLDNVWSGLNAQWAERQKALDEALRKASSFQDELMVCIN